MNKEYYPIDEKDSYKSVDAFFISILESFTAVNFMVLNFSGMLILALVLKQLHFRPIAKTDSTRAQSPRVL